ncbi:MAG: hypothetical protein Q9215_001634 [Flavoplaca cf. flavocitrina]
MCDKSHLNNTPPAESRLAYCTLSHRWGQGQPLKLTRDLYESFQQDIPFEDLPKTFADAAQITLNLGISYLWIDSLCICQDDHDDWLAESMEMGDIYANGICNIAALEPGGCYFDGPTPAAKALYFTTRGKHYLTIKSNKPSPVGEWLRKTPLGKRGWVFQEIVLSPRTLFYGVDGISWSCIEEVADEVRSMRHVAYSEGATAYKSAFANCRTRGIGTSRKMDTGESYRIWPELVSEYTDTVLTYDSDKWLAISGLAGRYMRVSDRRIVAGLDEDRLLEELVWWSKSPAGRVMNGAPTWSWLSCRSSIGMYAAKQDEMLATMITLPDKQLAAITWHTVPSSSLSTQPKLYPIRISGHVRPFCYTAQEGPFNESFDAKFQTYSIEAEDKRIWLDVPLEDGTTVWGIPHSWMLAFDPRLTMILIVPSDFDQDFWERVGVCTVLVYNVGKWDDPRDRESFLLAFGPVKELTII